MSRFEKRVLNVTEFDKKAVIEVFASIAKVVGISLGPSGHNALIWGDNTIGTTRDGNDILTRIHSVDDYIESIINHSITATKKNLGTSGDGTTTAYLFFTNLFQNLYWKTEMFMKNETEINGIKRKLTNGELIRYIKEINDELINSINPFKVGYDDLLEIAKVSLNNDPTLAKVFEDIFKHYKEQNIASENISIQLYRTKNDKMFSKIEKGFNILKQVDGIDIPKEITSIFRILLINTPISNPETYKVAVSIMEKQKELYKIDGLPLLVIAPSIEPLYKNKINSYYIDRSNKKDFYGIKETLFLELETGMIPYHNSVGDLCTLLGTITNDLLNIDNEPIDVSILENLPIASVVLQKYSTVISATNNLKTQGAVNKLIETLQGTIDSDPNDDKLVNICKARMRQLRSDVASIFVGANTESEVNRLYSQFHDAINAVNSASKEGVVAGMCIPTMKAAEALVEKYEDNEIKKSIADAYLSASYNIFGVLMENAGLDEEFINEKHNEIMESIDDRISFDLLNYKLSRYILTPIQTEISMISSASELVIPYLTSSIFIHSDEYAASNAMKTIKDTL